MSLNQVSRETIQEAIQKGTSAFIGARNLDIAFECQIVKLDDDNLFLTNAVAPHLITDFRGCEEYVFQVGMFRFSANQISTNGVHIIFRAEDEKIISDTRAEERFLLGPDDQVFCYIKNPIDQKTTLKFRVLDMSPSGISFKSPYQSMLFTSGLSLPEVRVEIDGKKSHQNSGEVVYSRKLMNDKFDISVQTGIRYTPE